MTKDRQGERIKAVSSYLVLIRTSHTLDNLLRFRLRDSTLVSHDLREYSVDLPSHVRRIAADVEVGFLEQKFVDFFRVLLEAVLHVDFLRPFAGEGGDEGEFVAEDFLVGLSPSLVLEVRNGTEWDTYGPFV